MAKRSALPPWVETAPLRRDGPAAPLLRAPTLRARTPRRELPEDLLPVPADTHPQEDGPVVLLPAPIPAVRRDILRRLRDMPAIPPLLREPTHLEPTLRRELLAVLLRPGRATPLPRPAIRIRLPTGTMIRTR